MKVLLIAIILTLSVTASFAQMDGNPENWCRGGFFTKDSTDFKIAVVNKLAGKKVKRSYFRNDDQKDCPGGKGCLTKSYVIPGNEVIVNREYNGFGCSWYTSAKGGGFVGWLDLKDLQYKTLPANYSLQNWIGEWTDGSSSINIDKSTDPGSLNVKGDAFWKGLGDNVHVGQLDKTVEPKNGTIQYSEGDEEYDCKATMNLVGNYLIVADNLRCGGLDVTFSGVYLKAKKK